MDAKEIKEYIMENSLLEDVLHKIGCHSIVPYSNEFRCALPNDDDSSKVSVFLNDDIGVRVFTKGETIYGSIFDLIMYIYNVTFPESIRKCLDLLGLSPNFNYKYTKKNNPLDFFRRVKRADTLPLELAIYETSILDKYSDIPHIDLIRNDGIISSQILDKYHIRFDDQSNRILIPHFHHEDKTKVVGVIGRTVNPAFKELKIPKYFPIISYEKSKNLYGFSHNVNHIKENGYVIVYESEKSVIKTDMFGYPFGVALGSHDLSSFQKKLLISLNVEIIIAMDKDVEDSHILNIYNELNLFRTVSYIKDNWNLLKEKDSPCDRGRRKFQYLLRNRIKL